MTEIIAAIITALSGMLSSWLSFRGNRSTSVSGNELEQMKALFPEEYSRLIKLQLAARIWEYQDQGRGEIAERICLAGIAPTIGLVLFLFVLNALGGNEWWEFVCHVFRPGECLFLHTFDSAFCPWRCLVVFEDHAKKGN